MTDQNVSQNFSKYILQNTEMEEVGNFRARPTTTETVDTVLPNTNEGKAQTYSNLLRLTQPPNAANKSTSGISLLTELDLDKTRPAAEMIAIDASQAGLAPGTSSNYASTNPFHTSARANPITYFVSEPIKHFKFSI